ncbi:hypothetical protein APB37_32350 [Pseudomonas aeruginosa]|nr:hypothetical protein APB37_32350 [Pseudomonas aeruginosa]
MRLCLGVIKCKERISKRISLSFLSNNRVTDGGWEMRLCYGIEASQAEGFLSIFVLGVLWSLKKGFINIEDAEGFIFKPATSKVVRDEFGFEELALLIDAGCELEDVKSLVFDKLDENIDTLIERVSHIVSAKTDGRGLIDKNIFLVNEDGE